MSDVEVMYPREEFEKELQALSTEALQYIEERTIRRVVPGLVKAMRPLVLGIEALSRATEQNTLILSELKRTSAHQDGLSDSLSDIMTHVQEKIDQRHAINQQLFDALHSELKDYKDGFLLEILQKPVVRDLIDLYDLLSDILEETERETAEKSVDKKVGQRVETLTTNIRHIRETLVEILERMEVTRAPVSTGSLDKKLHRAVSVEPAESSEEDLRIARSLKPGFHWRDRVFRPEEVVIKKWKEGYLTMMAEEPAQDSKASNPKRFGKKA